MLLYDDLAIFLAVARSASFKAGASQLELPLSTVSRRLATLETRLGVQLIYRTTRQFQLTSDGEELLGRCQGCFQDLDSALRQLNGETTLSGPLRVTAPTQAGRDFLGCWIMEFAASHPSLQIELVLSNSWVDLLEERFDLALRVGPLADSSLVATRLWDIPYRLVVSHVLLQSHGWLDDLQTPMQLRDVPGVIAHPTLDWEIDDSAKNRHRIRPQVAVQVNDLGVALSAVGAGLGVGYLPQAMLRDMPSGIRDITPPDWQIPVRSLYAVLPPTRRIPRRVRQLIEYLRTRYP